MNTPSASPTTELPNPRQLRSALEPYARPNKTVAVRQLIVSLALYLLGWVAMYFSLSISYWLTLLLAIPTAGLLVRIFIFFHDCGHNSFFPSKRANKRVGFWLGVLVFTPSEQWWHAHAIHHATSGNLEKRGIGDVDTKTVAEYQALSPLQRLGYRLFRFPAIMFLLGPIWMFLIQHRFPIPKFGKKETLSVLWTNLAILALATALSLLLGFWNYVLIQLPIIWIAGAAGIWLFFVQHQYPNVYWAHEGEWDYTASALRGASYYQLPPLLQWFSGNIGFHQIHHLNPRIPNYALASAYHNNPIIQQHSIVITLPQSLSCAKLALYDESQKRMIAFSELSRP
ncbi:MAG: fatty acid desaturase [Anaerolinea sp.]|nr:fatty acid desaturase [Anaerolinea sp.]